mmetsp:Transcript_26106/g.73016  ORF Transcript_26106/g.73016 Transcript_26106/m.73016 type:complete len:229 (-) Transcript_26106:450-1136(-)
MGLCPTHHPIATVVLLNEGSTNWTFFPDLGHKRQRRLIGLCSGSEPGRNIFASVDWNASVVRALRHVHLTFDASKRAASWARSQADADLTASRICETFAKTHRVVRRIRCEQEFAALPGTLEAFRFVDLQRLVLLLDEAELECFRDDATLLQECKGRAINLSMCYLSAARLRSTHRANRWELARVHNRLQTAPDAIFAEKVVAGCRDSKPRYVSVANEAIGQIALIWR